MVYNGLEDRLPNGSPLYIGVMKNKKNKKNDSDYVSINNSLAFVYFRK